MLLNDVMIRSRAAGGMIEPFEPNQVRNDAHGNRIISYGTTSYGYDARLSNQFRIFTNVKGSIVDPKNFDSACLVEYEGDSCLIPPNSFVLGVTVERFNIPRDILAVCIGKSTYARCGIVANVTPLEPEWRGFITLELSNTTPCPARVYANEGIIQVIFHLGQSVCSTSYGDRLNGKYQDQNELTLPRV